MKVKVRQYPQTYYDQLEGSGPFVDAVNRKVAEYWTATGHEMPIETAAFTVIAEFYDETKSAQHPSQHDPTLRI